MWVYQQPPPHRPTPPPNAKNRVDFRKDSTVCTACNRHLFKTEAVQCQGTCSGEFHGECSVRQGWVCGKCKEGVEVKAEDFDKLTSAVEDVKKMLIKTEAKITGLQVETKAGQISDSIEIGELNNRMQNIHVRFDFMEKQMNSLKAVVTTEMTDLKNRIGGVESKIIVLTAKQSIIDQMDISGVQDTLANASRIIVTEMTKTLNRLLERKTSIHKQLLQRSKDLPGNECLPGNEFQERESLQQKLDVWQQIIPKVAPVSQPHQKASRLQQLAAEFNVE